MESLRGCFGIHPSILTTFLPTSVPGSHSSGLGCAGRTAVPSPPQRDPGPSILMCHPCAMPWPWCVHRAPALTAASAAWFKPRVPIDKEEHSVLYGAASLTGLPLPGIQGLCW